MSFAVRRQKVFTYQDYLSWPAEERWEIIDGEAYCMTPAPKPKHQRIVSRLDFLFTLKLKKCLHFIAPTDVVFDEYNVVQPDIFIVCDKKKITENNIQGAPDLVIEVVSPTTEVKDKREKKRLYERFGVKEYIIVYPEREYVEQFVLKKNTYGAPEIYTCEEVLRLHTFNIEIPLWEVFEKEPPKQEEPAVSE